jgi:hypothetical protein
VCATDGLTYPNECLANCNSQVKIEKDRDKERQKVKKCREALRQKDIKVEKDRKKHTDKNTRRYKTERRKQ